MTAQSGNGDDGLFGQPGAGPQDGQHSFSAYQRGERPAKKRSCFAALKNELAT